MPVASPGVLTQMATAVGGTVGDMANTLLSGAGGMATSLVTAEEGLVSGLEKGLGQLLGSGAGVADSVIGQAAGPTIASNSKVSIAPSRNIPDPSGNNPATTATVMNTGCDCDQGEQVVVTRRKTAGVAQPQVPVSNVPAAPAYGSSAPAQQKPISVPAPVYK